MIITKRVYDRVNARNVELARQIRDLNEESKYLHEENRNLRYENVEQKDALKEIIKLTESNNYNNTEVLLRKIKELAETAINS